MNTLERNRKLAAALAAVSVNLVLITSLVSLARMYESEAARPPAAVEARTRVQAPQAAGNPEVLPCRPAAVRAG